jgi:peptide chain release factor 2
MAAADNDESLMAEVESQLPALVAGVRKLELMRMLSGPEDKSDAIVSIHPGMGGVDAQDFAEMLMRMYLRWCERKGFKTEILEHQPGDQAGIKDVSFTVSGPNAYGFLRSENGVHRLIRISPFDANARRQTSFAAVFVVPDLDDDIGDIEIRTEDLKVDTYRASGAGGQHVNKTESAVRFTHLPSGIVVTCQQERSQHKNRALAMKMLRGRLYEKARQEKEAAFESAYGGANKSDIDMGSQIRSYTMSPYTLVKDERSEHKVTQVDKVLDGDLDELIEAYLLMKANRKAQAEKPTS